MKEEEESRMIPSMYGLDKRMRKWLMLSFAQIKIEGPELGMNKVTVENEGTIRAHPAWNQIYQST